jgi:hypothetical protein
MNLREMASWSAMGRSRRREKEQREDVCPVCLPGWASAWHLIHPPCACPRCPSLLLLYPPCPCACILFSFFLILPLPLVSINYTHRTTFSKYSSVTVHDFYPLFLFRSSHLFSTLLKPFSLTTYRPLLCMAITSTETSPTALMAPSFLLPHSSSPGHTQAKWNLLSLLGKGKLLH